MESNILIQGSDFKTGDIESYAAKNGFLYSKNGTADTNESGVYNNECFVTSEHSRISKEVDGHRCEIYFTRSLMNEYSDERGAYEDSQTDTMPMTLLTASIILPQLVAPVFVESRVVPDISSLFGYSWLSGVNLQKVRLEGNFSYFFNVYARKNTRIAAFESLAPDLMLMILQEGSNYDIEFAGNRIYIYKRFGIYTEVPDNDTLRVNLPLTLKEYRDFVQFTERVVSKVGRTPAADLSRDDRAESLWKDLYTQKHMDGFKLKMILVFISIPLLVTVLLIPSLIYIVTRYYIVYIKRNRLAKKYRTA